jgi:hypothetical protein
LCWNTYTWFCIYFSLFNLLLKSYNKTMQGIILLFLTTLQSSMEVLNISSPLPTRHDTWVVLVQGMTARLFTWTREGKTLTPQVYHERWMAGGHKTFFNWVLVPILKLSIVGSSIVIFTSNPLNNPLALAFVLIIYMHILVSHILSYLPTCSNQCCVYAFDI